jgi:hypothetical protein
MQQDRATHDVTIPAAYWALEFDLPQRQPAPDAEAVAETPASSGDHPGALLDVLLASALVTLEVALDAIPLALGDWLDC